jgi:hypothetical protein
MEQARGVGVLGAEQLFQYIAKNGDGLLSPPIEITACSLRKLEPACQMRTTINVRRAQGNQMPRKLTTRSL